MWPLGEYDRLVHEIKRRENPDIPITFGLLVADYDQQNCREYILNYIERFDYKSDKYINFYLPGYLEEKRHNDNKILTIGDKKYYFDRSVYSNFLSHLETNFFIQYPYTPILILVEYDKGNFKYSKKIIIQLDSDGSQIKQTGELFEKIFDIARKEVEINNFSNRLIEDKIKNNLLGKIISCINNRFLTTIYDERNEVKTFRLS